MAFTIHNLGWSAHMTGDVGLAATLYKESLSMARQVGDQWSVFWNLLQLAVLHRSQARYMQAQELLEECLASATALRSPLKQANVLSGLAELELAQGNHDAARLLLQQCLKIHSALGNTRDVALMHIDLGWTSARMGDLVEAQHYFRTALKEATLPGMQPEILGSLLGLASLFAAAPSVETRLRAARLLSAIRTHAALLGAVIQDPVNAVRLAAIDEALKAHLPSSVHCQAMAEGQEFSLDDAVSCGLGER